MNGQLFTQYFLTEGIRATDAWRESVLSVQTFAAFRRSLAGILSAAAAFTDPNESVTELDVVRPIFDLLGWREYLPQQGTQRNEDIPDHLLFSDADAKARAAARPQSEDRYQDALAVSESKRFGLPLDSRDPSGAARVGTPHGQILRYLDTARAATDGRIRWGILTNGAVWRLYDYRARPHASGFYEADLQAILQADDTGALRAFHLLFRRAAFLPEPGATATFLEDAIAEGKRYEQRVAEDLSQVVFDRVFPGLVAALADRAGPAAALEDARHAALIFLYRLLFVLYAEDRGLLPVNDDRYDNYGLRKEVRDEIAGRMAIKDTFSDRATNYYHRLTELFEQIDKGDPSIGLPPYNGGLFAPDAAPLLRDVRLPDSVVATVIYDLSHTEVKLQNKTERQFVNYRDMSVQQLGSIYERLLEREPTRGDDGALVLRPNAYARKDSGSFYTPQELVDLIVEKTLEPLLEERLRAFEEKARQLKSDRRPQAQRRAELEALDPALAALDLKILDPAMGSGHFLVTAVDFLADTIADLVEYAPAVPDWLDEPYESPLVRRIADIRGEILERARQSDWTLDEAQLTDQAVIRRMVLKRCIYGVDKNPLAVELAKVALWLHSFTVGAPLSFLDHHLRCGDSLLGLRVDEGVDELNRLAGLGAQSAIAGAGTAAAFMQEIETRSDADVSEVRESASLFQRVEETTAGLRRLLDVLCGLRWLTAGMKKKERETFESPLFDTLQQSPHDAYKLLAHGPEGVRHSRERGNPSSPDPVDSRENGSDEQSASAPHSGSAGLQPASDSPSATADAQPAPTPEFTTLWQTARAIAHRENFLHWEAAFPGVWEQWQDANPRGGFDAVIGNPPWDRIKLQEVEWFATRAPALARAPTAAARRKAIGELRAQGDPLAADFDAAKARADGLGKLVRASGHYPLLGGGDVNLYSLFVERALRLVKANGLVGLLTPSGIYADKTAARFFQSVSTRGRVAGLYDFENKKIFFKDVHASFKFCALIVGGNDRRFDETACAFFLHDTKTIALYDNKTHKDDDRCFPLTPEDFARVNPNTGTAPVFRTRRDADITRAIYANHPVLVNRSDGNEEKTWPVQYRQGFFHSQGDSHLFRMYSELQDEGFYPVEGNKWKRGTEFYLPLYQGRMIWQFDHRFNSIRVNPQGTHNPFLSVPVEEDEHADPSFSPQPQFWVPQQDVERLFSERIGYTLAFRDITNPTNERTMVATIVPWVGCSDTLAVLMPTDDSFSALDATCLLANLNSLCLDYVVRQKVQATHIKLYMIEQFPVVAPVDYDRQFGESTAREIVQEHVLKLTYTSHDMAPFARELGHHGPPIAWNEEERRHLRARLDALYFHLYGICRDDAAYILTTFPIVQRQDESTSGTYRTRNLILAYMNALSAGDTETVVDL